MLFNSQVVRQMDLVNLDDHDVWFSDLEPEQRTMV